jgi:membrane-associated phospholipid phosphatase
MTSEDAPSRPFAVEVSIREKLLWAFGLTLFCSAGFLGIARMNALRAANGLLFLSIQTLPDRLVPFRPEWIWIYLSYYPGCFLPLVAWRRGTLFRQVAAGFGLQFATCFAVFVLMPVRMVQPSVLATGWAERAVQGLYAIDPGFNIFPSLHVANALLVAALAWRVERRIGIAGWIWAILMSFSALAVKQHYFLDVVAGAALGVATIAIVLVRWDGLWPGERARLRGSRGA